jgi:phytoene dehydrogenase-like protein
MSAYDYTTEDYLRGELEREREERERLERQIEQEREEIRRRRLAEIEASYHYATSWPEAFDNRRYLLERKRNRCEPGDEEFWQAYLDANNKAAELWPMVEAKYAEQISALLRQIQDLREKIRIEVADTLEASDPRREFAETAQQIREDDIRGFLEW